MSIAATSPMPPASPTVRTVPVATTTSSAQPARRENALTCVIGTATPSRRRCSTNANSDTRPPIQTPIARKCTNCAISEGREGVSAAA